MRRALVLLALLLPLAPATAEETVDALNGRIMQLYGEGRYQEATPLAQQLCGLLEKTYGPQSLQLASGLNNLAELYVRSHQPQQAEPLYRRSLAIRESQLPPDHPDVQKSRARLNELLQSRPPAAAAAPPAPRPSPPPPRANPAAEAMQRAIALNEKSLALSRQGRAAEALPLAKQVLTIFEANLPADHPNLAIGLANLAQLHGELGQYDEALPLYQRAVAILQKGKAANPANLGFLLANIADLYAQKHDFAAAEGYYRQAVPVLDKALAANDANLARILNNMAETCRAQGKLPEADPLMKGRIKPARMALPGAALAPELRPLPGPDDIEQAAELDKRLYALTEQKKFADALAVALELQKMIDRMYGADSLAAAVNLDGLVEIYRQLGRDAEAAPLIARAKAIRDQAGATDRSRVTR
jgi:tetratricopeptide (TPR) repeat protein